MKIPEKVAAARKAALALAETSDEVRRRALQVAAEMISKRYNQILESNQKDIEHAELLLRKGKISKPMLQRLKLDESKIKDIVRMVESVAKLEDPIGRTLYAVELDSGLELYKISCPIGVIGAIFEARPDVLPQLSALCLRSANAVILKGGREARHTNRTLFSVIKEATESEGVPEGWIQIMEERKEIRDMLKLSDMIDLIIPRGSREFVKYIQENTRIPVLGHAEGICHLYVDEDADLDTALRVCYDAKVQYPAVCNAVEKILVHRKIAGEFLPALANRYREAGVEIRGCDKTREILKNVKKASEKDWRTEYLDLIVTIRVVDDMGQAIDHINTYGSKHTDGIITKNMKNAIKFMNSVDSSSVMLNASTRFSDGYRYGLGAEVGISTGKIHARGPVGLEGLTTTKYYLIGKGHVVSDYIGQNARPFTHMRLKREWKDFVSSIGG
ncbi:MAG: glutamate-5-semialdehyde dehydrogenase [Candidatus Hadarchaeales archaeon]